jgi:membrane fusion protein, heavy metal efflux system
LRKTMTSANPGLLNAVEPASNSTDDHRIHGPRPNSAFPTKLVGGLLILAIAGGLGFLAWKYPRELKTVWGFVAGQRSHGLHSAPAERPSRIRRSWDGSITLTEQSREMMGLGTAEVQPQDEPIRLELLGTTEYIAETLTKTRSMFKGRVDRVYVTLNQAVKKGDPLIDLYSKELAEAKSVLEIEHIQWIYDKNLLEAREHLVQSKAISQQLFEETKNNEMKSRREYEVARHKLFVYGLSQKEVEQVESESGSQKARITLRSPIDGFVIERDVVPGNLCDENDTLLVIAPLDRLWVWGNVFESDVDLVKIGQSWEIHFPFLDQKLQGKVEYISNRVDPNTHAVRVRTSIPNADGHLKSDMLVRGMLEIAPAPGRTVIPRTALIVDDGHYYVFVQDGVKPEKFERRIVGVAQEKDDHVVIDDGLKPGEHVASVGGLLLAQMYEELQTAETGAPPPSHSPGSDR